MERSAVAYLVNQRLIVAPVVRTTSGLGLEIEPSQVNNPPDEGVLARALDDALAGSDRIVPHPTQDEWKGIFEPFQTVAGVRSLKSFMKDAKRVDIEQADGYLRLTPNRNLGVRDGFEPLSEGAVRLPANDLPHAAMALLRLLDIQSA
jgi:hypothetical protein